MGHSYYSFSYIIRILKIYDVWHPGLSSFFVGQVVQQQTEAIARLGNVLKRDIRDMEIIMAEDTELTDWANKA